MGIGTILTYGKEGDKYSFYEISSEVQRIAQDYFYYIEQSLAEVDIRIGDGRRVLQKELDEGSVQNFDVLVLDAFSGDAIPIHLLSVEASNLYWSHLKEDGVLVVHISNRHIDLSDVVRQMASYSGKQAYFMEDYGETADYLSGSSWVIVTDNEAFLANPIVQENISDWERDAKPILWTDDFSNLYDVIEWE
jgi:spermidine synthase